MLSSRFPGRESGWLRGRGPTAASGDLPRLGLGREPDSGLLGTKVPTGRERLVKPAPLRSGIGKHVVALRGRRCHRVVAVPLPGVTPAVGSGA